MIICLVIGVLLWIVAFLESVIEHIQIYRRRQKEARRQAAFHALVRAWILTLSPYEIVDAEHVTYAYIAEARENADLMTLFHFTRLPLFTVANLPDQDHLRKLLMYQSVSEFMQSGKREAIYFRKELASTDYCAICLAIEEYPQWFGVEIAIDEDTLTLHRKVAKVTMYGSGSALFSVDKAKIAELRLQIAELEVGQLLTIAPNLPLAFVREALSEFSDRCFACNKLLGEPLFYASYWGDKTETLLQRLTDD